MNRESVIEHFGEKGRQMRRPFFFTVHPTQCGRFIQRSDSCPEEYSVSPSVEACFCLMHNQHNCAVCILSSGKAPSPFLF